MDQWVAPDGDGSKEFVCAAVQAALPIAQSLQVYEVAPRRRTPLCVTFHDQILSHAHRLTIDRGVIPSLNAVAEAAGVSKGGLTHHFPTRNSLVDGLARLALEEIDAAMLAAVETGTVASTWLRLSVPSGEELRLFRALAVAHRALEAPGSQTVADATAAIARWEGLIADEVGDPVLARVIRLVGDGLAMNAFAGIDASDIVDLARLEEHLVPAARTARS